jgi:glutamate:GABA antiporter
LPTPTLRKSLTLLDLTLATILFVVVPDFFGTAVKAGANHTPLWLLGIALFFIPQALIVSHLNKLLPLEGGLYEWARHAFGDAIGFLVAWNIWLYTVLYATSAGLITVSYAAYAFNWNADALTANNKLVFIATAAFLAWLMLTAHVGLGISKWVTNTGSAVTIAAIAFLALLPLIKHPTAPNYHPLHLSIPPLTLDNFSVFSKMTFGALCGLEFTAIFAGESFDARRNLSKAILIAAPVIAALYILGTDAILAFVSPDQIDIIGPLPQAFRVAFGNTSHIARFVIPAAILFLLGNYLASFTLAFTANTRLPMCAGIDQLVPPWFSKLHAKRATPTNSIVFLGVVILLLSIFILFGTAPQEAFATIQIWSFAFYGIAYLALFAIPLLARRTSQLRCTPKLQLLAILGFSVTALFVILSIFPIIEVANRTTYTIKTIAALAGTNALGYLLYRLAQRTANSPA